MLERIYSPASPLAKPLVFFRGLYLDFKGARHLGWRLFTRDLKAQYRQSVLGYFWAFAPALFTMGSFIYLEHSKIVTVDTKVPYAVFVLTGTMLWQTFADSILIPLKVANISRPLLSKLNFPREGLLFSAMGEIAFNTLLRFALYFCLAPLLFNCFHPTLFLVPLLVGCLILLGFSLVLLFLPVALLLGDVGRALPLALSTAYLLTPVAYPIPQEGIGALISRFNPVIPVLNDGRELLLGHWQLSAGTLVVFFGSLLISLVGWVSYRVSMPHIVGRLGT